MNRADALALQTLLATLKIGANDEVVLPTFATCHV